MTRINQIKKMCDNLDLSNYYYQAICHAIIINTAANLPRWKRLISIYVLDVGGIDDYDRMEYFISKEGELNLSEDSAEELRDICKRIIKY